MSDKVSWKPEGSRSVTPHLVVNGASRAIEFYAAAFGAEEIMRMAGPDGSIMHAELQIGDSRLYLTDESPMNLAKSPATLGGTSATISLYFEDADATFERAVAAGAEAVMPPSDMFWGDRYSQVLDPFGHRWSISTHVEDLAPEEMGRRMAAFFEPQPA